MAKRFTDTELYEKDWFVALSPKHKLFWHYITSKCDTAGIWDVNIITACRIIGVDEIDIFEFASACNSDGKERILIFSGGRKIFVTTTISFQCGANLNPAIPAHRGIISSVSAHKETSEWFEQQLNNSLITLTQPLLKGCTTLKDKDKDKYLSIEEGVQGEKPAEGPKPETKPKKTKDEILLESLKTDEGFDALFLRWLKYKRERGESYKGTDSAQLAYNKLVKLSAGDKVRAKEIIEHSMSNNYAGLFESKTTKPNGNRHQQVSCIPGEYQGRTTL